MVGSSEVAARKLASAIDTGVDLEVFGGLESMIISASC